MSKANVRTEKGPIEKVTKVSLSFKFSIELICYESEGVWCKECQIDRAFVKESLARNKVLIFCKKHFPNSHRGTYSHDYLRAG